MAVSAAIAAVAASAAVTYDQGQKANKLQKESMQQAKQQADQQAKAADMATNKANMKKPNIAGMMDANAAAARGGLSSTMLTGPMGVDPSVLTLGKSTLLGGG